MGKTIKNTFLAAMITTVLCAGTVSARQLYLTSTPNTCRSFCTKKTSCPNSDLGCGCVFNQPGDTVGVCQLIAARPTT